MANTETAVQRKWAERIARWERSGLSRDEFAAKEGVSAPRLAWWRWHFKKVTAVRELEEAAPRETVSFVHLEAASPSASVLEVVLATGRVIRVPPAFDEEALARIVAVLERGMA